MAKSAVVLMLSLFIIESVFPRVDLAELSRLPDLWVHFQKHQKESAKITFVEFISMHYSDAGHSDATPEDHQKLPFSKTHNHRVPILQLALDLVNVNFQAAYTCLWEIQGVNYTVIHPPKVACPIWQPPKI